MHPFGGLKVVSTFSAMAVVAMAIDDIRPSRNRSRRIWKKLVRRRMIRASEVREPTAYMVGDVLYAHPAFIERMHSAFPERVGLNQACRCRLDHVGPILRNPDIVVKHCLVA